ncbi:hypothetical protein N657DRAFT_687226, partial [Parathielavia appendiculata]
MPPLVLVRPCVFYQRTAITSATIISCSLPAVLIKTPYISPTIMTFSSPTGATTPVASCADTPLGDEEINSWPASPSGLSSPTLLPIGTDVMAELFDMLRGRTRTQLHELESEANETIRRLWASYCAGGGLSANFRSFKHAVEKTVDEFKEARDEIYVDMACEYGRLQANMVWDALAARDLIPDQYIKLRFEIRDWHA